VAAAVKRYANLEGYQVLISMIDENVNHSIQDSINELKSQRVSKVIINVPLETEQAQKIATDNDDIVCLFLDVDPYSSVFNVSFNPADGTRASVKYLYELGHREIALLAGPESSVSAQLRLKSWIETLKAMGWSRQRSFAVTGMRKAAIPVPCKCCAKRRNFLPCWSPTTRWRLAY
jgi:DNA-binding LacI/PurR family transcriptional regulator